MCDSLLDWVRSFLTDRTQHIAAGAVWGPVRIRTGPTVVSSLCVYTQLSWASLSPVMASTCTSMPMICRSTSTLRPWTLSHCSSRRMSHCVSRRYRGLTEGQPTPSEPHQDSGYVVGFSPAAAEVPVASTRIDVSKTARELVVVTDSQLSLSTRWPSWNSPLSATFHPENDFNGFIDPKNLHKDTEFIHFHCHGNQGRSS